MAVKQLALGLVTFPPAVPASIAPCSSSTWRWSERAARVLPVQQADAHGRHIPEPHPQPGQQQPHETARRIPWNYPVKVHTYEEWEDEFHDKIEAAGLPVERNELWRQLRSPKNSSRSSTSPAQGLDGPGGRVPQGHLLLQRARPRT